MKVRTRTKAAMVGVVLVAVVGALAVSTGAFASVIPATRSVSPGTTQHWGLAWNSSNFPNKGTANQPVSYSGYGWAHGGYTTAREQIANGRNNAATVVVTPVSVRLTEPFNYNNQYLAVSFAGLAYADPRAGARLPALHVGGTNAATNTNTGGVWCSMTEWADTSAFVFRQLGFNSGTSDFGNGSAGTVMLAGANSGYNWATTCPFIQAYLVNLCSFATPQATVYTCIAAYWTAERAFDKGKYLNLSPTTALCSTTAGAAVSVDCQFAIGSTLDPTDFNQVCIKDGFGRSAPTAAWLDFSWIPNFISFYSDCLFRPRGGIDRLGVVAASLTTGNASTWTQPFSSAAASFSGLTESCGQILSGAGTPLGSTFFLDTCTWTWAAPGKAFLSVYILCASGLLILIKGTGWVTSMFAAPNPANRSLGEID